MFLFCGQNLKGYTTLYFASFSLDQKQKRLRLLSKKKPVTFWFLVFSTGRHWTQTHWMELSEEDV